MSFAAARALSGYRDTLDDRAMPFNRMLLMQTIKCGFMLKAELLKILTLHLASGRCVNWYNLRLNELRTAQLSFFPRSLAFSVSFSHFEWHGQLRRLKKNIGFITKQTQQINYIHSL